MYIQFVMGNLASATTLINAPLYEGDNATLFRNPVQSDEVHIHTPLHPNAGYTLNNCSIYNQVGNEF
jgi:hypothetical protein